MLMSIEETYGEPPGRTGGDTGRDHAGELFTGGLCHDKASADQQQ